MPIPRLILTFPMPSPLSLTIRLSVGLTLAALSDAGPPVLVQRAEAGSTVAQDETDAHVGESARGLAEVLEPIQDRVEAGDIPAARALLDEILRGGIAPLLEGAPEGIVNTWLEDLDGLCGALGNLDGQLEARSIFHDRLADQLRSDHPDLLGAKGNLAVALWQLGDLDGAHALFEEVLESREHSLNEDHPDLVAARHNLAMTSYQLGDLEGARALQEDVLRARESALSGGHPDLLSARQNLGVTLWQIGDLDRALALFEQVHEARAYALPDDHVDLLKAKLNLAGMRLHLGDLDGARELLEHVHAEWAVSLPDDHPYLLAAKQNLASTRKALGDLEGALVLEEDVLRVREEMLPADHPDLLVAKQNLAGTRLDLGDPEGAYTLFERVHSVREKSLPEGHPELLIAKQNLAVVLKELGDLESALELEERVLGVWKGTLAEDHPDLLLAKQNLAATRSQLGDFLGALELEQQVLEARERTLSTGHPGTTTARMNLATTRAQLGDLAEALTLGEEVLRIRKLSHSAGHPDLILASQNLALIRKKVGDHAGAHDLAREIAQGLLLSLERAVTAAPREARATAAHTVRLLAENRAWSDAREDDSDVTDFEVLETARYVATAPLHTQIASLASEEASTVRRKLSESVEELDRLLARGPSLHNGTTTSGLREEEPDEHASGPHRMWAAAVQQAALRRDRAQKELISQLDRDFLSRIDRDEVASSLTSDAIVIGITKLRRWDWDEDENEPLADGFHYLAYVLQSGGHLHVVDLGRAEGLEQLMHEWRSSLGVPISLAAVPRSEEGASAKHGRGLGLRVVEVESEHNPGHTLRAALIDPIVAATGGPTPGSTLHFCLDGALSTLPLEALPLEDGTEVVGSLEGDVPRLGDLYRIRHEISMARLLQPKSEVEGSPSALLVGDVDFEADLGEVRDLRALPARAQLKGARFSGWGEWAPLPGTEGELRDLAALSEELLGAETKILRGRAVTSETLAEVAAGKRYVHLATHGWFLPETVKSLLDEEPQEAQDLLGTGETVSGFVPLALCGLVLSGVNAAEDEMERSARLLTALELSEFDLSDCDLAVLSACETNVGVGISRAGQSVQSLQTALHMAGARTSVTSLWNVDDEATRTLMRRFYENLWEEGMGKAEALWEAKKSLRREGRAPRLWAGWVLAGDPD